MAIMMTAEWDYIIIGGGSAGCVLANRLSANQGHRVLLLEAGDEDRDLSLRIPAGLMSAIFNKKFNWNYPALADQSRNGFVGTWSGGRVLGGSSSINGMLYIRGAAADYDGWAGLGCDGWDYRSLLPHFRAIESFAGGANEFRGGEGEVNVSFPAISSPIVERFVEAAQSCGHGLNRDYNAMEQDGVAIAQANIRNGRRHSAARAFLHPVRGRPNLTVMTGARVRRIVFEGSRAVAVEYRHRSADHLAKSAGEIVVSAGAIATPHILMHSGIGDAAQLKQHNIAVVHHAPQVGQNLMEHPCVYVSAKTSIASLNRAARPYIAPFVLLNWLLFGKGAAAVGTTHAQVLCRSAAQMASPDLQLLLSLVNFTFDPDANRVSLAKEDGIALACCLLQPKGRGQVRLVSGDPDDLPMVDFPLLGEESDIDRLALAARRALDIFATSPLRDIITQITFPLARDAPQDEWRDLLRTAAFRGDHPSGTVRMGADDQAVLDPQLRVRGVQGLRVADASIMPVIPSANTNAPVMMIGEKAAVMMLDNA